MFEAALRFRRVLHPNMSRAAPVISLNSADLLLGPPPVFTVAAADPLRGETSPYVLILNDSLMTVFYEHRFSGPVFPGVHRVLLLLFLDCSCFHS